MMCALRAVPQCNNPTCPHPSCLCRCSCTQWKQLPNGVNILLHGGGNDIVSYNLDVHNEWCAGCGAHAITWRSAHVAAIVARWISFKNTARQLSMVSHVLLHMVSCFLVRVSVCGARSLTVLHCFDQCCCLSRWPPPDACINSSLSSPHISNLCAHSLNYCMCREGFEVDQIIQLLEKNVDPTHPAYTPPLFVDIGANIGHFTTR